MGSQPEERCLGKSSRLIEHRQTEDTQADPPSSHVITSNPSDAPTTQTDADGADSTDEERTGVASPEVVDGLRATAVGLTKVLSVLFAKKKKRKIRCRR